uniref:Uncharacterized protein n=1 Tax=Timema bartmani TaxID=61472 RepID=A0A7R9HWN6_9NEOP|nr:unnamed protein product [Timema bartmani]
MKITRWERGSNLEVEGKVVYSASAINNSQSQFCSHTRHTYKPRKGGQEDGANGVGGGGSHSQSEQEGVVTQCKALSSANQCLALPTSAGTRHISTNRRLERRLKSPVESSKVKKQDRCKGLLLFKELKTMNQMQCIKQVEQQAFESGLEEIKKGREFSPRGRGLSPFLDQESLLSAQISRQASSFFSPSVAGVVFITAGLVSRALRHVRARTLSRDRTNETSSASGVQDSHTMYGQQVLKMLCCYGFSNETWNMTLYWWMQCFWITKATLSVWITLILITISAIPVSLDNLQQRGGGGGGGGGGGQGGQGGQEDSFSGANLAVQDEHFSDGFEIICGGAVSYVMYRRHYLNKPQTLNDKCSNQDSSCYIDDSTLRKGVVEPPFRPQLQPCNRPRHRVLLPVQFSSDGALHFNKPLKHAILTTPASLHILNKLQLGYLHSLLQTMKAFPFLTPGHSDLESSTANCRECAKQGRALSPNSVLAAERKLGALSVMQHVVFLTHACARLSLISGYIHILELRTRSTIAQLCRYPYTRTDRSFGHVVPYFGLTLVETRLHKTNKDDLAHLILVPFDWAGSRLHETRALNSTLHHAAY